MRRSTDICTCDHARDDHYLVVRQTTSAGPDLVPIIHKYENACAECPCLGFFPHPQPNTAERSEPSLEQKLLSFLVLYGSLYSFSNDSATYVALPNGERWKVTIEKIS